MLFNQGPERKRRVEPNPSLTLLAPFRRFRRQHVRDVVSIHHVRHELALMRRRPREGRAVVQVISPIWRVHDERTEKSAPIYAIILPNIIRAPPSVERRADDVA